MQRFLAAALFMGRKLNIAAEKIHSAVSYGSNFQIEKNNHSLPVSYFTIR